MKLLAIDTSTEQLSVAVCHSDRGPQALWQHNGPGGAYASDMLIPVIENLLAQAGLRLEQLDAICFGCGPGSFTGLRTACSVAQGLAYGAGAWTGRSLPVLPVDTLLAVAETARAVHASQAPALRVMAALDARMDEVYATVCTYAEGRWQVPAEPDLLRPEALDLLDVDALAGNVMGPYGERIQRPPGLPCWDALPTAAAMLRLAPRLLVAGLAVAPQDALPRYVRNKVAQTTEERAAAKAAQVVSASGSREGGA